MANYEQNYDANSFQVAPYQMPVQPILQAVATRNQYWDAGASQIKNAYQNYLNLDLTRKDNRDKLDNIMQGVNNQIKTLSKTDLSLAGNVNDALSAFDPIYKNDDIMGDNAITKWYKTQMSLADSYRNKDNGKGYSDTNVRYLMQGLQDYANDPNGGSNGNWRKYYNERKEYSPAYDVGEEVHELMKDYKPTVFTKNEPVLDAQGKPTGYFRKIIDKQQTAAELNSYLQSNLSDKAKQQMRITGSVMYNRNYAEIGKQLYYNNSEGINSINKAISSLTADLKNPKATAEEKANIQSQIDSYNANLDDYNRENKRIKSGDFSFIKDNYDSYAASLYGSQYIKGVARSNDRRLEYDDTLSPDEVALTALRESNKFEMERRKEEFQARENALDRDITLLKIRASLKGKEKPGLDEFGNPVLSEIPSVTPPKTTDETGEDTKDYQQWVKEIQDLNKTKDNAVSNWNDYIKQKAVAEGIDIKDKVQLDRYTETYEKNHLKDPTYASYLNTVNNADFKIKTLDYVGKQAEDKIYQENKKEIDNIIQESKKYNPEVQKLVKLMVSGKVDRDNQSTVNNIPADVERQSRGKNGYFVHFTNPNDKTIFANSDDWLNANNIAGKISSSLDDRRKQLLSADFTIFKGYREFSNTDNAGYKAIQDNIDKKLGVKDANVTVRGYDRDGRIYVQLNTADPKVNNQFVEALARLNNGILTPSESYRKDKGLFIIASPNITGAKPQIVSDPRVENLKDLAQFEIQKNPGKNSYFVQPKDWPLKLGDEYYNFEMHYVDGKQYWYPIHTKSGVKLREENFGYETIEQAVDELVRPDNQSTIRKIILQAKPDYKF